MTAEAGPVSVAYPPMFGGAPFVVTCSQCPEFRAERVDEGAAWRAADSHQLDHR